MRKTIVPYDQYMKYRYVAEEIRESLFGKTLTHAEWAEAFNQRGLIIRILVNNE